MVISSIYIDGLFAKKNKIITFFRTLESASFLPIRPFLVVDNNDADNAFTTIAASFFRVNVCQIQTKGVRGAEGKKKKPLAKKIESSSALEAKTKTGREAGPLLPKPPKDNARADDGARMCACVRACVRARVPFPRAASVSDHLSPFFFFLFLPPFSLGLHFYGACRKDKK